jgi:voltage-gated potassium channel Kch
MRDSLALAAFLAQGGEFAFVLFTLAVGNGLMPQALVDDLILVVIASMIATPFVVMGFERLIVPRLRRPAPRPFDAIDEAGKPVIIAGFGRFGQIVGRVLRSRGIGFTAIDGSAAQVDFVRRFGNKIYYGDPARLDILRAAEIEHARAFVLAMDDVEGSVRCAETLQRHFPNVPVFARARNRQHAFRLMDLGVKLLARETYFSSLHVAEHLLVGLGFTPSEAERTIARFREHDERLLAAQHAVKDDEKKLMQTSQEAAAELKSLFEADAAEAAALETRQVQRAS